MKKGIFLPVLFILGLVASGSSQSTLLLNGEGDLSNASNHLISNVNWMGIEKDESSIFNVTNNLLAKGVAFPVYNSDISKNSTTKIFPTCILKTSRINAICSDRLKSLIKD